MLSSGMSCWLEIVWLSSTQPKRKILTRNSLLIMMMTFQFLKFSPSSFFHLLNHPLSCLLQRNFLNALIWLLFLEIEQQMWLWRIALDTMNDCCNYLKCICMIFVRCKKKHNVTLKVALKANNAKTFVL